MNDNTNNPSVSQDSDREELLAQIASLKADNNKLKAVKSDGLSFRVSVKGGVSVYGMGRFPVTLYHSQWVRLIGVVQDGTLPTFISEKLEAGELKVKEAKPAAEEADAS